MSALPPIAKRKRVSAQGHVRSTPESALHFVRASKRSFLDSIRILCVPDILHDHVAGTSHHLFSPWRSECERPLDLAHDDKAHGHALRTIGHPTVDTGASDWSLVALGEVASRDKNFLVSGFRTPITNNHVSGLGRRTLRFLAFALDGRNDDLPRFGWPDIDRSRLAGNTIPALNTSPLKVGDNIDRLLRLTYRCVREHCDSCYRGSVAILDLHWRSQYVGSAPTAQVWGELYTTRMSALGQKQTYALQQAMSALAQ
jgi:hypothetical protein